MENLVVALSNLPAIYPIRYALNHGDYKTAAVVSFVASCSFFSHLVENHKHGMPGIGFNKTFSYYANRLDVLACIVTTSRFLCLYYTRYGMNIPMLFRHKKFLTLCLLPFIFLRMSEYDKYNPKLKHFYMLAHTIWHVSIFYTMKLFMQRFLY